MNTLKQSTAAIISLGPFVDPTDNVTAMTALAITQADIRLDKNGAGFAQTHNVAGATHDENGYYLVPLDTTDTATLGRLRVAVSMPTALPVWQDFLIQAAYVYDAVGAGAYALVTLPEVKVQMPVAAADEDKVSALIDSATAEIETYCQRQFVARDQSSWLDGNGRERLWLPHYPVVTLSRCCMSARDVIHVAYNSTSVGWATVSANATVVTLSASGTADIVVDYATYTTLDTVVARINTNAGWTATRVGQYGGIASTEIKPANGQGCLNGAASLYVPDYPAAGVQIDETGAALVSSGGFPIGWRNIYVGMTAGYTAVPNDLKRLCIELIQACMEVRDGDLASESLGDYSYSVRAELQRHATIKDELWHHWRRKVY